MWCAALSDVRHGTQWVLTPEEQARAARFRFAADRQRFIASHHALRAIVGAYLGMEPAKVRFLYSEQGKPYVAPRGIAFSFTHSSELGLVALSLNHAVGIDIEHLRPLDDLEAIAERFLSASDAGRLRSLPPDQRRRGIFACWTRWEAYLKATGAGLAGLEAGKAPGWWHNASAADGEMVSTGIGDWAMYSLEPAADYVGAVAVCGTATLKTFRWAP